RSRHRPFLHPGPRPALATRAPPCRRRLSRAAVSVRGDRRTRPRDAGQLDACGSGRLRGDVVGGLGARAGSGVGAARGVPGGVGGRVVTWNAGAERIKGYSPEEIIGQHFSRFYPPEDVQERKPERELQVAAAEGRWADEGWRVRKDGSRFWASVVITALRSAD